jgi:hypothetical protein
MSRARFQSVQALLSCQRWRPPAMYAKPLIFRSFQAERQKARDGHFGALSIQVTAEQKPQKEHDLGINGAHRPQRPCPAQSRGRAAQMIPGKLTVLPRIGAS